MRLTEAEAFVRLHRESWQPSAKGYPTTVFNFAHVVRILGDMECSEVRTIHFAQLVQKLKEEGMKPGTINRIQSALSTVLNTLFQFEMLDRKVSYSRLREPRGRLKTYSEDELLRLIVACSKLPADAEVVTDLVIVASKTGARQGELLKLTWECVDLEARTMVFLDTKTHEDRVLPILGEVYEILSKRYEDRIDDGQVFPITKDTLLRRLRRAQRAAGIEDKELCFHTLRHQAATQMFSKGAALPEVMAVLGHKNPSTTMRYSHATQEGINRALNLL